MADSTRCTESGCEPCASVIPFDATRADRYADTLAQIASDTRPTDNRAAFNQGGSTSSPTFWSDDTPHRYAWPTTD